MERHVEIFLSRISYASIVIATLTLLLLYFRTPETCFDPSDPNPQPHTHFPTSSCDFTHRPYVSLENRNRRIWATDTWSSNVSSYSSLFKALQARRYISKRSRVLISSAGRGQAVHALNKLGVEDVTAVELVEYPPLVSRADPHNLPFFDGVFDLGLGVYLDQALFPRRYVSEIERTVRVGGICVVTVAECGKDVVEEMVKLFTKSRFVDAKDVRLAGENRKRIVMRVENQS